MALSTSFSAQAANAAANAITALCNSGYLVIYSGAQPAGTGALTGTLLATFSLGATAFASAVNGVANGNAVANANIAATGNAGYCAFLTAGGAIVVTGSVGTSGCNVNIAALSLVAGAQLQLNSFNYSHQLAASGF